MISALGLLACREYSNGVSINNCGVNAEHRDTIAAKLIDKLHHLLGISLELDRFVEIADG
jgi:hypothetical protein